MGAVAALVTTFDESNTLVGDIISGAESFDCFEVSSVFYWGIITQDGLALIWEDFDRNYDAEIRMILDTQIDDMKNL